MKTRATVAAVVLGLAVACSASENARDSDGTWVGAITTEGNVTTVVNESGSVWGGTATLVEEMSIGVEAGADEYMFGIINSVYASEDRIYVVDAQVPIVRMYDHAGVFRGNFGKFGAGPGEYRAPGVVAVDGLGRVFVLEYRLYRINVYSAAGETIGSWPIQNPRCCNAPMHPVAPDALWIPVKEIVEGTGSYRDGGRAVGPSGEQGEAMWIPNVEPARSVYEVAGNEYRTPFSAGVVWSPTPAGGIVFGASDEYRYEVHRPDGSTLVVQRHHDPVSIPAAHREWERRFTVATARHFDLPGWTWDGSEMPHHKPAFSGLTPALSGDMWVSREGVSEPLRGCSEDPIESGYEAASGSPCWTSRQVVDVFAEDGHYLGEVQLPSGMQASGPQLFVNGRLVLAVVQSSEGVAMVKRYRLVLPGEEQVGIRTLRSSGYRPPISSPAGGRPRRRATRRECSNSPRSGSPTFPPPNSRPTRFESRGHDLIDAEGAFVRVYREGAGREPVS